MGADVMGDLFLEAMKQDEPKQAAPESRNSLKKGIVVAVSASDVFLDLGSKSECVVPVAEFKKLPAVGETIDVVVKDMRDGVNIASILEADKLKKQGDIKKAFDEGLPVSGKLEELIVKDGSPKGFSVDLGLGNKAFLPLSHADLRKDEKPETLKGTTLDLAVIEYKRNNVTVSRREFLQKTIKKLYTVFFEKHQTGDVLHGKVERVEEDFIVLGVEGIRAFMHVSDFSWKFLSDMRAVVKIGDEMDVMVIKLDDTKNSVKVGRKQLTTDPWSDIGTRFKTSTLVKGKVINYRKDGALIEVEDGIEAFLPVEEMSWTEKVRDPRRILKINDVVEVKITNIEPEKRRMDVSLREIQDNPWANAAETYPYGKKVEGVVTSIVDFGVFVKLDDGIEGLMRKEDVDWLETEVDLKERFKKGDRITALVMSVDTERERLRLGYKQLSDNPYKAFSMNYPKGSPVTGTVKSVNDNGAVVALENNLEGFIHISQISREKVEKVADALKVGDEVKALVKNVDGSKNKIELSIKEFLTHEERSEVAKYSGDSDAGATTMGALLKEQFANIQLEKKNAKKSKSE